MKLNVSQQTRTNKDALNDDAATQHSRRPDRDDTLTHTLLRMTERSAVDHIPAVQKILWVQRLFRAAYLFHSGLAMAADKVPSFSFAGAVLP